jgi:hypothetical protein
MNDDCFMHIQGVKLYDTSITGKILWDVLILPNGLNSSKVKPSLTFLLSDEKSRYKLLNDFHATPSARCLNTSSFVWPSAILELMETSAMPWSDVSYSTI